MKLPLSANNPDPATTTQVELKQYMDIAKDMLVDATESAIYMCGMAPLDLDDPFFDIFQCDPTFDCDSHIESEFLHFENTTFASQHLLSLRRQV